MPIANTFSNSRHLSFDSRIGFGDTRLRYTRSSRESGTPAADMKVMDLLRHATVVSLLLQLLGPSHQQDDCSFLMSRLHPRNEKELRRLESPQA